MAEVTKTMKLHIRPSDEAVHAFRETTEAYRQGCNYVSEYIFCHDMNLTFLKLTEHTYQNLRKEYGLKAQLAQSVVKTVIARYKTVESQLEGHPYRYKDESGRLQYIPRTLKWLVKPVLFSRPQADYVRNRDYSFVADKETGERRLSLNTLSGRVLVPYDVPEPFAGYFDGTWKFGTGKLVRLKGEWYFHLPVTAEVPEDQVMTRDKVRHVVGIDRGLRFLAATYDEKGKNRFFCGRRAVEKRHAFQKVRDELQARGTKSSKRALKRISGRENRWMSDVNHRISKTLVDAYGKGTLFVMEDLTGVSFSQDTLGSRTAKGRKDLRSWPFYQLEQDLTYKAQAAGSAVLKVDAHYTSQRCPKCGRIHRENRLHSRHLYRCDRCGYQSNDDRLGAMNIQMLGTFYVSGMDRPKFAVR